MLCGGAVLLDKGTFEVAGGLINNHSIYYDLQLQILLYLSVMLLW
jgi:hypothetical protein